jgi:formylmethanofuran dehydrogenase subunit D
VRNVALAQHQRFIFVSLFFRYVMVQLENHAWNQSTGMITMPGGPWANAPPAVQFL